MKTNNILGNLYQLSSSSRVLDNDFEEQGTIMVNELLKEYSAEEISEVSRFITSYVDENNGEVGASITEKAREAYIEGFKGVKKYMDMAEGYQEMGNINLSISEENHHLEGEATQYEMGTKKTETKHHAG